MILRWFRQRRERIDRQLLSALAPPESAHLGQNLSEISGRVGWSFGTVLRRLDRLEEKGLIMQRVQPRRDAEVAKSYPTETVYLLTWLGYEKLSEILA